MGNNSGSKGSFKNSSLNNQFNFVGSDEYTQKQGKPEGRDNQVFTKFAWKYGGHKVFLTGSFNDWKKNIAMDKNGQQFSLTLLLPRAVHQYKFIVDGEWRFSPEDPTMPDSNGHINNFIQTTNFEPIMKFHTEQKKNQSGPIFQQQLNNKPDYKKLDAAPKLPIHYEYCQYLKNVPQDIYSHMEMRNKNIQNYEATLSELEVQQLFKSPHCLPMPTHVTLDHMMTHQNEMFDAMAITKRCKQKYTTYTYFSVVTENTMQ